MRCRAAIRKADIQSVRGPFKFGPNQHPIQDWYALTAEKSPSGEFYLKTGKKVLRQSRRRLRQGLQALNSKSTATDRRFTA